MAMFKKIFSVMIMGLLLASMQVCEAHADSLMVVVATKVVSLFNSSKSIIFIVGGFGLVGLTFYAVFGRLKWTWLAGLAVGLGILAAAAAVVNYSTGDYMDGMSRTAVVDTFGAAAGEGNITSPGGTGRYVTAGATGSTPSTAAGTTSSGSSGKSGKTGFWNGVAAGFSGKSTGSSGGSAWYNTGTTVGATAGGFLSGFIGGVSSGNDQFGDSKINY